MEAEEEHSEKMPDRPLECSECKKPVSVLYTEMVGNLITKTCMCEDCPELQRRLKGTTSSIHDESVKGTGAGLTCGNCGTALASVRVSSQVGCSECYEVFGDVILSEMVKTGLIRGRTNMTKRSKTIYVGRQPGETQELKPSLKLIALNEALKETLAQEDYEQAALLRDQIKELTENSDKKNEEKK